MHVANLLVCIPLLLAAAVEAGGEPRRYILKNKEELRAEILEVDGERVSMRIHIGGGSVKATRDLAEFAPQSAYNIMRSVTDPNDAADRIRLAEFATANGLIAAARRELRKAGKLARESQIDPEFERRLIAKAIPIMDDLLRKMIDAGKISDARYVLSQIVHSELLDDAQKAQFIDLVEGEMQQKGMRAANAKATAANAAEVARRDKLVDPVRERLTKGRELRKRALLQSKSFGTAIRTFDRAIQEFERVQRDSDRILKKNSNDAILAEELTQLSQRAEGSMISSLLDQASLNLTRSQYSTAISKVNRVLVMDDGNSQALAMRARIEIAANRDGFGI